MLSLESRPGLMADGVETEAAIVSRANEVTRLEPPKLLAAAAAGAAEPASHEPSENRWSRQFACAKLSDRLLDTALRHGAGSVGDVGFLDDLPSDTCRKTYMGPHRREGYFSLRGPC
jgi:hypothetical protein